VFHGLRLRLPSPQRSMPDQRGTLKSGSARVRGSERTAFDHSARYVILIGHCRIDALPPTVRAKKLFCGGAAYSEPPLQVYLCLADFTGPRFTAAAIASPRSTWRVAGFPASRATVLPNYQITKLHNYHALSAPRIPAAATANRSVSPAPSVGVPATGVQGVDFPAPPCSVQDPERLHLFDLFTAHLDIAGP